jgi:hypothetical protein
VRLADYPRWLARVVAVWSVPSLVVLLGFGIAYVVLGNAGGKVIGSVLLVLAAVLGFRLVRSWGGR